ncbi:MAG: hypothetical protein OEU86_05590 [Gammaproteobacteria bacterium]|nr:hypothetical protein [Gammaproteobacteria bacterium]
MFAAAHAQARCNYPETVLIPDGATATYEQMNDAQAKVKQYMADMETYLDCLQRQEADAQLQRQAMVTDPDMSMINTTNLPLERERNSALNAMESLATRFNEQVRAYKIANP